MGEQNVNILGISGSLRRASFNTKLLKAAAELAPAHVTFEFGSIEGIPLYNGDLEDAEGMPKAAAQLKEAIAAADAILIATPEYNNSMPGVLKNALDWVSRPMSDLPRVFGGKPTGLMGASPGRLGTVFSQTAWLPVFRAFGVKPWFGGSLYVGGVFSLFDEDGRLTDEPTRQRLTTYMQGFVDFART